MTAPPTSAPTSAMLTARIALADRVLDYVLHADELDEFVSDCWSDPDVLETTVYDRSGRFVYDGYRKSGMVLHTDLRNPEPEV